MIKYQIVSALLWPDIKLGEIFLNHWSLQNIEVIGKKIKLLFLSVKGEEVILYLKKTEKQKLSGKISRNFQLLVFGADQIQVKSTIKKNSELINYIAAVIKKNDTSDFLFLEDKDYFKSNPIGIVFTITHKCNLNCSFCFNSYDYELKTRAKLKDLNTNEIFQAINNFHRDGIRYIILSGGEPLIRPDFFEILDYLAKKKFYVVLNTNGILISSEVANKLAKYPVHIMMSVHQFSDVDGSTYTSLKDAFSRKKKAIKALRKYGVMCLEFITILNRSNIEALEKIYQLSNTVYHPDNWQFFRVFDANEHRGSTAKEMQIAIDKLDYLNKKYKRHYQIVDAVPYCVHKNLPKAERVISGDLMDSHMVKLVTDPKGNIKLMGLFHINLGNILKDTVKSCWEKEVSRKLLNLTYTPKECRKCLFLKNCGGGSRMVAHLSSGKFDGHDPLVNLKHAKPWLR